MDQSKFIEALKLTAKVKLHPIDVPGWGRVYLRALTVAEIEEQTEDVAAVSDKHRLARAAARLLCDVDGNRLLDANNGEHIALLAQQPWALLQKVLEAAEALNPTTQAAITEAKNV